ncbi:MAG: STAS domain-containing protein [Candidatus Rokuibacteriota bacterium]
MTELGRVSIEAQDDVVVAHLAGELDLSNWEQVRATLEDAVTPDNGALVLELGSTTYFDSAGVRLVFQLAEGLRNRRQGFALVLGDNQIVQRVAELTGICDHVACHPDVAAAVKAVGSDS